MRGVALIIGNSAYEHLTPLENPETDADAIEKLFDDLGFETYDATDADLKKLRRTIDRFIEDAEGVDVALVYYAGHGVEAGGENYLIPVDADISSLDDAGEKLVALSELMRRLREAASLSFVLLDACRDNPFPPGSTIRATVNAAPLPVSASGLGETRTMKQFRQPGAPARPAATNDSLGTLIGFSAEPGQRALDGEPGGNSPYATAVLRHVPAMAGEEISTVMRMVAEEVYLKTDGRQRPWVNENLRRLVFLGSTPPPVEGVEGDILRERRQLLINIAAIPSAERSQIEKVAREGKVSMDWVYAMVRALGDDAPKNPAELEAKLKEQVEKIKTLQGQRDAIFKSDPEIARLSALADQAAREGAIETALKLHEQAKARVEEVSKTVDDVEASLKARRLEFGEVYARSARENYAAFRFEQAAADYEKAFREVERWDAFAAWSYRGNQAVALMDTGWKGGDTVQLHRAVELAREVVTLSEKTDDRANWAISQAFLGNALMTLGQRTNDQSTLSSAIEAYQAALTVYTLELYPNDFNIVMENLIGATKQIAQRYEPAKAKIELAKTVEMFDSLLSSIDRTSEPLRWASIAARKGATINDLAQIDGDQPLMRQAITLLTEASSIYEPTTDTNHSEVLSLLASSWFGLGIASNDRSALEKADALYVRSLALTDKAVTPVYYSDRLTFRAVNLRNLYLQTKDAAWLEKAIPMMREGRDMIDPEKLPIEWRSATISLGDVLTDLGRARKQASPITESVNLFAEALRYFDPAKEPEQWADTLSRLADARRNLGEMDVKQANFTLALDEHEQALRSVTRDRFPRTVYDIRKRIAWISTSTSRLQDKLPEDDAFALLRRSEALLALPQSDGPLALVRAELGIRLYSRALRADDAEGLKAAIATYRSALVPELKHPDFGAWAPTQSNLGRAFVELARIEKNNTFLLEAVAPTREAIAAAANPADAAPDRARLARIYDELSSTNDPHYLRLAADVRRDALTQLPASATLADRASTQESLAIALTNLAIYSPDDAAKAGPEAIAHYRAALDQLPTAVDASERDRMLRNLALSLHQQGERVRDTAMLGEAAEIYRNLSAPGRKAGAELDADRLSRSTSLLAIARINNDKPSWAAAVASYEQQLGDVSDAKANGPDWHHFVNFAESLRESGYLARDMAQVRRSIDMLGALLTWPAERLTPADADSVRINLANTQLYLGDLDNDVNALAGAITQFRQASTMQIIKASPQNLAWLDERLALSHLVRAEITDQPEDWREGVSYMRKVAAASADSNDAVTIARNAGNLAFGIAHSVRAGVSPPDALAEALPLATSAVDAAKNTPDELPYAQSALCISKIEDGRIRTDRKAVETGLALCRTALDAIKALSKPATAIRVQKTVAYGEAVLAKM